MEFKFNEFMVEIENNMMIVSLGHDIVYNKTLTMGEMLNLGEFLEELYYGGHLS